MPESLPEHKVVVTDTSCFIILKKIDATHILRDLFAIVITTPEIAEEYGYPLPSWVIVQAATDVHLQKEFSQYVDPGEASAIALASEIKSDYLIADDAAARKFAEQLGLHVKGSVGVLLSAKQAGLIPLIRPYLELIQQTNFRISQSLISKIIQDADE